MPLDRRQPEYRAVAFMLTDTERVVLDRIVDESLDDDGVAEAIANLPVPSSVQARFRIALWFWNGGIPIERHDVLRLDPRNRARFVSTLASDLGVLR